MTWKFQGVLAGLRGVFTIIFACSNAMLLSTEAFVLHIRRNWSYSCLLTGLLNLTFYMNPK